MHPPLQDPQSLNRSWLIAKRRWFPAILVAGSIMGLTVFVTSLQKPIYEASGKLMLNKSDRMSSLTGLSEKLGEVSALTQASNPLETEAEVIRSNPMVRKVIQTLNLKDATGESLSVDQFLKRLKIKSVRGTDVMELSFQSTDPKQAADVINLLMQSYLENNVRNNRAEATAAREFMSKQLPEVEARVRLAEADVRAFKEANQVVALQEEAKTAIAALNTLSDQLTKARAELADTNSQAVALQSQLGVQTADAVALSSLSQSAAVQGILEDYRKVQDELAVQRTRYQDEHPEIAALLTKEAALKEQLELRVSETMEGTSSADGSVTIESLQMSPLKQNITADVVKLEAARLGLTERVQVLSNTMVAFQSRIDAMPQLEETQSGLERKLQVARSTYEQLLKRLQEVEVVENQNVGNARIVSESMLPEQPVSPRMMLNMAIGGLLGLLGGVAIAMLLEAIDKSLKTSEEAKQLYGYPILGTIPMLNPSKKQALGRTLTELPVRDNPYSIGSAAYEMLQATLGFTVSDKALKVIVVSSAMPSEGKSSVSANLAVATAQLGKRVLLIDADMRCPRQQEIWQVMNYKGLSEVLVGQAQWKSATTEVLINLDLLTAGTNPPNPVALLDSKRMQDLIDSVSNEYDFVIIDTPPLNVAADSLILSKVADGALLVVRPGVVHSDAALAAKARLEQSSHQVLGMVLNGVNPDGEFGAYYYPSAAYYGRYHRRNPRSTPSESAKKKAKISIFSR